MPYKDKAKQREANRAANKAYRERKQGITPKSVTPDVIPHVEPQSYNPMMVGYVPPQARADKPEGI